MLEGSRSHGPWFRRGNRALTKGHPQHDRPAKWFSGKSLPKKERLKTPQHTTHFHGFYARSPDLLFGGTLEMLFWRFQSRSTGVTVSAPKPIQGNRLRLHPLKARTIHKGLDNSHEVLYSKAKVKLRSSSYVKLGASFAPGHNSAPQARNKRNNKKCIYIYIYIYYVYK